jgi:hypothetical protein
MIANAPILDDEFPSNFSHLLSRCQVELRRFRFQNTNAPLLDIGDPPLPVTSIRLQFSTANPATAWLSREGDFK